MRPQRRPNRRSRDRALKPDVISGAGAALSVSPTLGGFDPPRGASSTDAKRLAAVDLYAALWAPGPLGY